VKSKSWDEALLAAHRHYLWYEIGREAFDALVETAIALSGYQCAPGWHGEVRDFNYNDTASGERPFAFTINREHLLFYVRAAGLNRVPGGIAALSAQFATGKENSRGEWTVRIRVRQDAERVNALLFGAVAQSHGIPEGITREDVLNAIRRLDSGAEHRFGQSLKFDLVFEARRYPPKAVIGIAAERLAGRVLTPRDFTGGNDSKSTRILRDLGFPVEGKLKTPSNDRSWQADSKAAGEMLEAILADLPTDTRRLSIEALNHSIAFAKERYPDRWVVTLHPKYVRFIAGMVLCLQFRRGGQASILLLTKLAPRRLRKNGGEYKYAPGCVEAHLPTEELATEFSILRGTHEAAIGICATAHAGAGSHRRAHSPALVVYLEHLRGRSENVSVVDGGDPDIQAEIQLRARTDIPATEMRRLINARIGQGIFRDRVIELEGKCRVTGVTGADHLRASHIKPWKDSTDQEKLDGNNGLLLAPHIDHLFDKGYISFNDSGDLIVSAQCPVALMKAWGIDASMNVGPFRQAQQPYLAHHRRHVLKPWTALALDHG
jgi:HNH endonuclease